MLILILMVVAVVGPLAVLVATEVRDAKWDREYYAAMDKRVEANRNA